MDESYLSDASVVAATRDFVCIRLSTYEDKEEAEFLKSIFVGRSGELENTTFAILSPDGKQSLTPAGRGPRWSYRNSLQMADGLQQIAARYSNGRNDHSTDSQLPTMKSLELALNVASCDNLPLILTVAEDKEKLARLHDVLRPLAWSEPLAGQFVYASVSDRADLEPISGGDDTSGILVVHPDQFGLAGHVIAKLDADKSSEELQDRLQTICAEFPRREKSHNSHVRLGIQLGVEWESQIPETDPQSVQARQRARGGR